MVNSYVNEMSRYGMFVSSHFCIHKYTGAIAAAHVMRNGYIFIHVLITGEMKDVLEVPAHVEGGTRKQLLDSQQMVVCEIAAGLNSFQFSHV